MTCPHCGYMSNDHTLPISMQDNYEIVPNFQYNCTIKGLVLDDDSFTVYSYEDNRNLYQNFGKWDRIKTMMPGLAEAIQSLSMQESILVADMNSYVKRLIASGDYRFSIDRNGNILPTIRDKTGIFKQVRLREMEITPNITQAFNNLYTQALMAQILGEIRYVGNAIKEIHVELQNDRLAKAESAYDKLVQARQIQDAKLREVSLLNLIGSATDAKRILMRNFTQNMQYIEARAEPSTGQMVMDHIFRGDRDIDTKATDALQALTWITNSVQIECEGYSILGEHKAARECLVQFNNFITNNQLTNRDKLLHLLGNSKKSSIT